ncbi:MAG TPA: DUF1045 domain-containing protein [Aliidongia sp.]|nr:DUF1045 domain-containing protein [Aliidongia sp.]
MSTRYALYAVPAAGHPLWIAAARWLGRDAETDIEETPHLPPWLEPQRWREITAEAGRYGFHGTLKPPMALAQGEAPDELEAMLGRFAATEPVLPPVRLEVATIAGFVALLPRPPSPGLSSLAGRCVERFDRFRAPASDAELARRRAAGLSSVQETYLERWGYPYVFDQFRYHMTLTSRLSGAERDRIAAWLHDRLAPVLSDPVPLELALFVEAPGAPFRLRRRFALSAQ